MERVDVIIPTYKPDWRFLDLMEKLARQSVPVHRIIIMNTEQKYFDRLVYGTPFAKKYHNVLVRHLSKREFDHGRTRNNGVRLSDAEVFIMMTQDAVPADEFLVEKLLKGLKSGNVAVAYARQIAQEASSEVEKFTRNFNYPDEPRVKTIADVEKMGIKAFFCSNVCAAYKRDIFDSLGGFIKHTIFNEDMIYAAGALRAGYGIAYQPEARVYHSHDYGNKEQFHRYFDLGVSQTDHPEVFEGIPSESEGARLVKLTIEHLRENKMQSQIPGVILNNAFKYLGYLLGRNYRKLPRKIILKCTSNKDYWD
ncbi:MAG: glycosyltransferase family 2 protein [Roseburia sp.]|nr:glycosyltransferase family 2 protein [Roseburia sp.]MCM1241334.1 glycosyltransferase family 2 protein [Roseburia sp.]